MEVKMQIGKNGMTDDFMNTLRNTFKNYQNVRISVLKSSPEHNKEKIFEIAERIKIGLGEKYTTKVIGYTILVKKWRKVKVIK